MYNFLTLFYISGLLLHILSCCPFLVFTAVMVDQPQKVFNKGHICDQIVQGL